MKNKKYNTPSKRDAMNLITTAATLAGHNLFTARSAEVKAIGDAILLAKVDFNLAEKKRVEIIEARDAARDNGGEYTGDKPASRAKLVTKLRNFLAKQIPALKALKSKLAKKAAKELQVALDASRDAYLARQASILSR